MVVVLDLTLPYQKSLHKFGATVLTNELPDKSQFDAVCPRPTALPRSPPLLPTALEDLRVKFSMPKVFFGKKFSHLLVPQVFEIPENS